MSTLIYWIEQQMACDDEDRSMQSLRLRALYEESGIAEQRALDDALICICGYSFQTAYKHTSEDDE